MSTFLILVLAVLIAGSGFFAYRQGFIRSRAALFAIAIVIGLLLVWRMAPGVAPTS